MKNRKQAAVQVTTEAIERNHSTAQRLSESTKITISAAVLAFAEIPIPDQLTWCNQVRLTYAGKGDDNAR